MDNDRFTAAVNTCRYIQARIQAISRNVLLCSTCMNWIDEDTLFASAGVFPVYANFHVERYEVAMLAERQQAACRPSLALASARAASSLFFCCLCSKRRRLSSSRCCFLWAMFPVFGLRVARKGLFAPWWKDHASSAPSRPGAVGVLGCPPSPLPRRQRLD